MDACTRAFVQAINPRSLATSPGQERGGHTAREHTAMQASLMAGAREHKTCLICGCADKLVRDHNHKTGMIRGLLCNLCNRWLGTYEANKNRTRQCGRRRFKQWVEKYKQSIEEHLKRDTGILYPVKSKASVVINNFIPYDKI